jgi:hypothetical protein
LVAADGRLGAEPAELDAVAGALPVHRDEFRRRRVPVRRSLDEDLGLVRIGRDDVDRENGPLVGAAGTDDLLDGESAGLWRTRQRSPRIGKECVGLSIGLARDDVDGEVEMGRNADLLADADVEPDGEPRLRRRIGQLHRQRQDNAALIDVDHRVAVVMSFRWREADRNRSGDVGGGGEVRDRGDAGVAGASPIGLPAGIEIDLDTGSEQAAGADAGGDEAHPRIPLVDPIAHRRSGGQYRRNEKRHRRGGGLRHDVNARPNVPES